MSGEALGRRLLRLDAAYCAGAGAIALLLFSPLARLLDAPEPVPAVAGALTIGWAYVLLRLAARSDWRRAVTVVALANVVAAAAILALGAVVSATLGRLLLAAVAMEVAALAAGQVVALRRRTS
jgi:hypothetical protein